MSLEYQSSPDWEKVLGQGLVKEKRQWALLHL